MLSNRPEVSDSDFKWTDMIARSNNELLANLGNFVNRALAFTVKQYVVRPESQEEMLHLYGQLWNVAVHQAFEGLRFESHRLSNGHRVGVSMAGLLCEDCSSPWFHTTCVDLAVKARRAANRENMLLQV